MSLLCLLDDKRHQLSDKPILNSSLYLNNFRYLYVYVVKILPKATVPDIFSILTLTFDPLTAPAI